MNAIAQSEAGAEAARSPWHRGEIALQKNAGAYERMNDMGKRVVRSYMPEQHRQFFAQLPFAVFGSVDTHGDPWATMLAGKPGFMHTLDDKTLDVTHVRDPLDPAPMPA